jgi:uncharacterized protein YoxC
MNSAETRKLANSQTLSQVATGLIIALSAFLAFALDKRELGPLFLVLISLGTLFLVLSLVLGGRGIASLSSPRGLFNYQAWTCLLGFIILASSLFALGKPLETETTKTLAHLSEELGAIKAQLGVLGPKINKNRDDVVRNEDTISQFITEINELKMRVSEFKNLRKSEKRPRAKSESNAQQ